MFNRECSEQSAAARFTVIIMLSSRTTGASGAGKAKTVKISARRPALCMQLFFGGEKAVQGKRQIFRSREKGCIYFAYEDTIGKVVFFS